MSTVDTIDLLQGKAANFLDAGGKATPDTIKEAFRLVLNNPDVKVVLVNVFGGVIQGDMIATGILAAVRDLNITHPVVARVQGTNGAKGMQMVDISSQWV
jgi:succinyl-CoA synthetase beta subunit